MNCSSSDVACGFLVNEYLTATRSCAVCGARATFDMTFVFSLSGWDTDVAAFVRRRRLGSTAATAAGRNRGRHRSSGGYHPPAQKYQVFIFLYYYYYFFPCSFGM